jgi:preprotein translocase subunit YajC
MTKAATLAAAFVMTVLSICANLPAQATQETIAPAAVQRDNAATPVAAPVAGAPAAAPVPAEIPSTAPAAKKSPADQPWMLIIMVGVFILFYVWLGRGRKKEQKKRTEMLSQLKKGDKVTTIGGIIGVATDVQAGEVVVKVDETSNTKIRFARWAIRGVGEDSKAETPQK